MRFVVILLISFAALLVGAAVFFGWSNGLEGIVMSPFLAIFGWYLAIPIFLFVGAFWLGYRGGGTCLYKIVFAMVGGAAGLAFSFLLSGTKPTSSPDVVEALRLAFTISGAFTAVLVSVFKPCLSVKNGVKGSKP